MNRTLAFVSALGAGLMTMAASAQTAAPAPHPATAAAAPQAVPAKIALIAFEQAVFATNEGQRAVQDVRSWSVIFQARLSSWQCAAAITRVTLQAWLHPLLRRSGALSGALAERGGATRWASPEALRHD